MHPEPEIYFAASIRGGREDVALYLQIVKHLQRWGKVNTEHIADKRLAVLGEDGLEDDFIHNRDLSWLFNSGVVVAEVTQPSLGVGYELGRIAERGISPQRVLCLYRPQEGKKLSAMIRGAKDNFTVRDYQTLEDAVVHIDSFFSQLGHQKK